MEDTREEIKKLWRLRALALARRGCVELQAEAGVCTVHLGLYSGLGFGLHECPHATFSTLPPLEHCFLSYVFTSPLSRGRTLPVALPPSPYRFSSPVSVLGLVFGPPIRSSLLVARYSTARTYSNSTNIRLMYAPSVRPSAASLEVHVLVLLCSTLFPHSHSLFHSRSHSDCHSESLQLSPVSLSSER